METHRIFVVPPRTEGEEYAFFKSFFPNAL